MTDDSDISYIKSKVDALASASKPNHKQRKLRVNKLKFWCTACTQKFEINKKDADGKIQLPQQVCPHVTLTEIEMIKS